MRVATLTGRLSWSPGQTVGSPWLTIVLLRLQPQRVRDLLPRPVLGVPYERAGGVLSSTCSELGGGGDLRFPSRLIFINRRPLGPSTPALALVDQYLSVPTSQWRHDGSPLPAGSSSFVRTRRSRGRSLVDQLVLKRFFRSGTGGVTFRDFFIESALTGERPSLVIPRLNFGDWM